MLDFPVPPGLVLRARVLLLTLLAGVRLEVVAPGRFNLRWHGHVRGVRTDAVLLLAAGGFLERAPDSDFLHLLHLQKSCGRDGDIA